MEKTRIAINGVGRIGRAFYKVAKDRPELEIVAINDLGDIENIAYLLKYDTVYGRSNFDVRVSADKKSLEVDGKNILFFSEKEPSSLPWKNNDIDVVVESTGFFTTYQKSKYHIDAGAKRVVVTAPMKDDPTPDIAGGTVLVGVNDGKFSDLVITSNSSCTTNAAGIMIAILEESIGVEKALLNTTHAMTNSQPSVDSPNKSSFREGRASSHNIVPASTGAAIGVTKVLPQLEGLFDGISMRVPVLAGSIVDVTFISKRNTTVEEINKIFRDASVSDRWKNVFAITEDETVSSDILGMHYGSIADIPLTRVVGGNLVKVVAWYDNEIGYAHTLVEHVVKVSKYLR